MNCNCAQRVLGELYTAYGMHIANFFGGGGGGGEDCEVVEYKCDQCFVGHGHINLSISSSILYGGFNTRVCTVFLLVCGWRRKG